METNDTYAEWLRDPRAQLVRADELRLYEGLARADDEPAPPVIVRGRDALAELAAALAIAHPLGGGNAPADAPRLELRRAGLPLATLTLVNGRVMHWPHAAPPFARLTDDAADRVCAWLAARGFETPRDELAHVRRRERLWDTIVARQRAQLPAGAPDILWEPGHETERQAALVALLPEPELRAAACFKVLGAAHPEWFVGLPLDRLIEPWLHDAFAGDVVASALHRVWLDPHGLEGAVRWLVHAGGAEALPASEGLRILPGALRHALMHPVARNRTEALELLDRTKAEFVVPILHEVFADAFTPRPVHADDAPLLHVFSDPETFYLDDALVRGTSDRAYAALLLARRGEARIRERVRDLMDTAGEADFHALALAIEALDRQG